MRHWLHNMNKVSSHSDEWTPLPLDIPHYWEQVDFEDAFENISISHLKIPQNEYLSSGALPIVDQGINLIGGFTNDASKGIQSNSGLIVFGDHTKHFKLIKFRFAPGADGVKVFKPNIIDGRFAYYACRALRLPNRGYSRHYSFLRKSKFPLAPLGEQLRIADKIEKLFSELDKGIESLKSTREQLKIYRQAVLKHAFEGKLTEQWREENRHKLETPEQLLTRIRLERDRLYQQQLEQWNIAVKTWEMEGKKGKKPNKPKQPPTIAEVANDPGASLSKLPENWFWLRLGHICEVTGGLTKNQTRNNLPRKLKYLRVANVYADKLLIDEVYEIGVTDEEARKVALKPGDLLIVEGNGSIEQIGRVAVWDGEIEDCGHQNHLIRARITTKSIPRFILQFLLSPLGRDIIAKEASSTSGLHTLSISKVSNITVPTTSRDEEIAILDQIAEKLLKVDNILEDIEIQLSKSDALRQSILKQAFTGQLVQQDPNDEPASILLERIRAEKTGQEKIHGKNSRRKTGEVIV